MSCVALPPEILSLIFSFLSQDQDILALRSCSLVHKSFLPIAQRFLFEHIFLLPEPRKPATALAPRSYSLAPRTRPCYLEHGYIQADPQGQIPHTTTPPSSPHPCQDEGIVKYMRSESLPPYVNGPFTYGDKEAKTDLLRRSGNEIASRNPCSRLLHLLIASPVLASYVKRLTIVDGRLFPHLSLPFSASDPLLALLTRSNAIHSFTLRDKINGPPWVQDTPSHVFSSLFSLLCPTLQKLDLVFPNRGPKMSWNTLPVGFRRSLCTLFRGREQNEDGREVQLQGWTNQLERVEIRNIKWDNSRDAVDAFGDMGIGVREIVLRGVRVGCGMGTNDDDGVQTSIRNTPNVTGTRGMRGRTATRNHTSTLYVNPGASVDDCDCDGQVFRVPFYESNVQHSGSEQSPNLPTVEAPPRRTAVSRLEILCVYDNDFEVERDINAGKESLSLLKALWGPWLSGNANNPTRSEAETLHTTMALRKVVLPDVGEPVSSHQLLDMLK